jgi:hypothetical protein
MTWIVTAWLTLNAVLFAARYFHRRPARRSEERSATIIDLSARRHWGARQ